jgi:PAS domain S-box-containing protein
VRAVAMTALPRFPLRVAAPVAVAGLAALFHLGVTRRVDRMAATLAEQRRRTEASEAKYRVVVEQVPEVVYTAELGLAGRWHYVSPQIETMLGFSPEEWCADPELWFRQVHPDDRDAVMAEEASAIEYGRFSCEYRLLHRDGRILWVDDSGTAIPEPDTGAVLLHGFFRDVTERKRAEQERQALEDRLRQSQKMEAVGQLAGGVAHDFNNMLAVIINYASFLEDSLEKDDPRRADVGEILASADRAAALVRQLLTFSRRDIARPQVLDAGRVISGLGRFLRTSVPESIALEIDVPDSPLWTTIDPNQLEQVLTNLAVNARDAMSEGGRLEIRAESVELEPGPGRTLALAAGRYVRLTVADTGAGIPGDIAERIFEPFYTTKPPGRGTGLGLAMVYGIITEAGGDIQLESRPGEGTRFDVFLPWADARARVASA